MAERSAEIVWLLLGGYLAVGLLVAGLTLLFGLRRLEPGASAMPLAVRLLIAPGLTALWPLVLARLMGLRAQEDRR